jgi:hypothetical protein
MLLGAMVWWAAWPAHVGLRIAVIGDVFAAGALIIAVIAGVVAIRAYAAAAGRPDLVPIIRFPGSAPNEPRLLVDPHWSSSNGKIRVLADFQQLRAELSIRNDGRFSARTPALRVHLEGLSGLRLDVKQHPRWQPQITGPNGYVCMQWDGGADGPVHGNWERYLPKLNFKNVMVMDPDAEPPVIRLEVVAEGYRCERAVPITLVNLDEWAAEYAGQEYVLPEPLQAEIVLRRSQPSG